MHPRRTAKIKRHVLNECNHLYDSFLPRPHHWIRQLSLHVIPIFISRFGIKFKFNKFYGDNFTTELTNAMTNVGATPSQNRWNALAEYPWAEARKIKRQVCLGAPNLNNSYIYIDTILNYIYLASFTIHLKYIANAFYHFSKYLNRETCSTVTVAVIVYRFPLTTIHSAISTHFGRDCCSLCLHCFASTNR